jgi:hypothetical protein
MSDTVWQFKDKKKSRESFYGNLRELCKNESIIIKGKLKKEEGIRYLIKTLGVYSDENYLIKKVKVKRSKIK